MKGIITWILHHRTRIIIYLIMMCATIGVCYHYIENKIWEDKHSCLTGWPWIQGYNLFNIIHYELDSIPKAEDESERQQMYGYFDNYFKIADGWYILKFKRSDDTIKKYRIYPFAAMTDRSNPVDVIEETQGAVIESFHTSIQNIEVDDIEDADIDGRETKFHRFKRQDLASEDSEENIRWWNFNDGRGFVKEELVCSYSLVEKSNDILYFQLKTYSKGLLIYCTCSYTHKLGA